MNRKLLIVLICLLIGVTSVFGADCTWGGAFSTVYALGITTSETYNYAYAGTEYAYLSTNFKIDDFNTVSLVLDYAKDGTFIGSDPLLFTSDNADLKISKTELTTDIFGSLGLDLPATLVFCNGFGSLGIHDKDAGVGTGWDPEIFKTNGTLSGDDGYYIYMGLDSSLSNNVNMRLYVAPVTLNKTDFTMMTELWVPWSLENNLNLDAGFWLVLEDGWLLGEAEETIPAEPDGNLWVGARLKGDKTFANNTTLGFWLGGLFYTTSRYNYETNDKSQKFSETAEWTFVEALSLDIRPSDSLSFELGFWVREKFNSRVGDALKEFQQNPVGVQRTDPELTVAFDFKMNYKEAFLYGGFLTTDIIVDQNGAERTNIRWDFGIGYSLGASVVTLGLTGPTISKDVGQAAAYLPENDLLVMSSYAVNNPVSSNNVLVPVLYVLFEARF